MAVPRLQVQLECPLGQVQATALAADLGLQLDARATSSKTVRAYLHFSGAWRVTCDTVLTDKGERDTLNEWAKAQLGQIKGPTGTIVIHDCGHVDGTGRCDNTPGFEKTAG